MVRSHLPAALSIVVCIALGAGLRLPHLGWDDWHSLHPDERGILYIAESPSPNPYRTEDRTPRPYAYGQLPLFILRTLSPPDYHTLLRTARTLSTTFDVATIALTGLLAYAITRKWPAAFLAAALVTLSPLHIQNATYGTVDTTLAFFATLSAFGLWRFNQHPSPRWATAAGIAIALALSTKITAFALLIPAARVMSRHRVWFLGALVLTFALTSPFALLDAPQYLTNIATQAAVTSGRADVWFTQQYANTLPLVYPLTQMGHWGMGWAVTLSGCAALGIHTQQRDTSLQPLVLWCWVGLLVASVGFVKFPRYLLIVSPTFFVLLAVWVTSLSWRTPLIALLIITIGGRAATLEAMYNQPHPWVAASEWAYATLPEGTALLSEARDDALPLTFEDQRLVRDWRYNSQELPIWDDPTPAELAIPLATSDVYIISSPRGCAVQPGFYKALFAGELGYTLTHTFERRPFFTTAPCNSPLDESFIVYDHPRVFVFENTARLTLTELLSRLQQVQ